MQPPEPKAVQGLKTAAVSLAQDLLFKQRNRNIHQGPTGSSPRLICSFVPHRKSSSSNANSLRRHYRHDGKLNFTALPISGNPVLTRSSEGADGGKVSLCQTELPVCVRLTFRESLPRSHSMARQWATCATCAEFLRELFCSNSNMVLNISSNSTHLALSDVESGIETDTNVSVI